MRRGGGMGVGGSQRNSYTLISFSGGLVHTLWQAFSHQDTTGYKNSSIRGPYVDTAAVYQASSPPTHLDPLAVGY